MGTNLIFFYIVVAIEIPKCPVTAVVLKEEAGETNDKVNEKDF